MSRNVIVTGASRGIGYAVAASFAAAGDRVLITGRHGDAIDTAAAELGSGVTAAVCDASDPTAIEALEPALPVTVDVLVNNAGGNTDFGRPAPGGLKALAESWHANLDANLLSAVLMTTAVAPRFASGGTVVSIGSIAADKGAGSYGAAKAGLASWNAGLAAELGPRDITANVVAPGYIERTEFFRGQLTGQRRDALIADTCNGRPGTPDDIAGTVLFLASPATRHVTGQVIAVNGGARTTR
ncbi:MAG: SDR family oxidoreductase [Nocardiopsaceae bacterium]|nr:SDR family oxidoreductase [Nocardiopsaceae bacterium]